MEKQVVVQDANVLMDLINGGVLDVWFRLGTETWTTDFVVAEIIRPDQQKTIANAIKKKRIHVAESPPGGTSISFDTARNMEHLDCRCQCFTNSTNLGRDSHERRWPLTPGSIQ